MNGDSVWQVGIVERANYRITKLIVALWLHRVGAMTNRNMHCGAALAAGLILLIALDNSVLAKSGVDLSVVGVITLQQTGAPILDQAIAQPAMDAGTKG
jgi:hypothetical protein